MASLRNTNHPKDDLAEMKVNTKGGRSVVYHFRKLFKRSGNQADLAFEFKNLFSQTIRLIFARKLVLRYLELHVQILLVELDKFFISMIRYYFRLGFLSRTSFAFLPATDAQHTDNPCGQE